MALNHEQQSPDNGKDLPLVLLHRSSTTKNDVSLFTSLLHNSVRFIDPPDELDSSCSALSGSVRLMLSKVNHPVASQTLDRYPSLECIVATATGLDHIDLTECRRRRGIRVANAGVAYSDEVAEHAVGLLIDVLCRVSLADQFVRAGSWPPKGQFPLGSKVSGKRVGIVGLGNIGMRISKRLEAFGCSIAYYSRRRKPNVLYPYYVAIKELAINSDILFICCTLAKETHHIINNDVLTALGKKGVVINIGRGAIIDEKELVQFLVRGEIGRARLDVFDNEPHVPRELCGLDNVVLSPHRAAAIPESFARLQEIVAGNIQAFFLNKPLLSEVELQ